MNFSQALQYLPNQNAFAIAAAGELARGLRDLPFYDCLGNNAVVLGAGIAVHAFAFAEARITADLAVNVCFHRVPRGPWWEELPEHFCTGYFQVVIDRQTGAAAVEIARGWFDRGAQRGLF